MAKNTDTTKYPIFTNKLEVKINRENVDKQFVIYQVGTENLHHKNNVLDLPTEKYKAQSVAYYRNNRWFAMFNKGTVDFDELKQDIHDMDEAATVNEVDLFSTDVDSKDDIKDVELAQLLVNSLKNRSSELFSYNNITGNLYYSGEARPNKNVFEFLKLRFFTPEANSIALEANTETFSEVNTLKNYGKSKASPNFVFDEETGEFRRKLHDDFKKGQTFFDKGAISRKGAKRKFLDFSAEDDFRKSKIGVIAAFLHDVKENLADYISIAQIPFYNYEDCEEQRDNYENTDYSRFLKEKGVCVVNTVKAEESGYTDSKNMQSKMIDFLKSEYQLTEVSQSREKGKYIIEIIHNKESNCYAKKKELIQPSLFEEDNKPEDQHNLFAENEIIQHITVEDSFDKVDSKTIKDVMHNIIQELIIKGNVVDRQISLVNWNEPKEWTFVKCGKGKWNTQKKCYDFCYYKMTISSEGKLSFDTFNNRDFPESDEWAFLDKIFNHYNKDGKNQYSNIECVVYNNIENVNVIYKTKQFTLPNIEELARTISLSDGDRTIAKAELEEHLNEFISLHDFTEDDRKDLEDLFKNLQKDSSPSITYKKLLTYEDDSNKKHFLMRKKLIKQFVNWLYDKTSNDETPVLLNGQMKNAQNMYKNFNSFLGIKSMKINGPFEYFVGKKEAALQQSLATSCIVRDVIPWDKDGENKNGHVFFEELKHMLSVEFVRNGQYTVIPFPMKYLNEYVRFKEKDVDYEE